MSCINSWSNILKEGTIEEITNQKVFLIEKLTQPSPEIMKLDISLKQECKYFRIMRDLPENKSEIRNNNPGSREEETDQIIISGLIFFLDVDNFPDGIFLEINESNDYVFHIIELKRNPNKLLPKISRQFLSAYLHCKTIYSMLHLDLERKPIFKFYVAYNKNALQPSLEKHLANRKYNNLNSSRLFVGEPPYHKFFRWYEHKSINFTQNGHEFDFSDIVNIPLYQVENITENNHSQEFSSPLSF